MQNKQHLKTHFKVNRKSAKTALKLGVQNRNHLHVADRDFIKLISCQCGQFSSCFRFVFNHVIVHRIHRIHWQTRLSHPRVFSSTAKYKRGPQVSRVRNLSLLTQMDVWNVIALLVLFLKIMHQPGDTHPARRSGVLPSVTVQGSLTTSLTRGWPTKHPPVFFTAQAGQDGLTALHTETCSPAGHSPLTPWGQWAAITCGFFTENLSQT